MADPSRLGQAPFARPDFRSSFRRAYAPSMSDAEIDDTSAMDALTPLASMPAHVDGERMPNRRWL